MCLRKTVLIGFLRLLYFETLKSALTQAPILAIPDFLKALVLEIGVSGTSIGQFSAKNNKLVHKNYMKSLKQLQNSNITSFGAQVLD